MLTNHSPRDRTERPEVDVVIPVFKPGDWLRICIESVRASVGVRPRIVVVDDTPHDPEVERFLADAPDIRLIAMPVNSGFVTAVNAGIRIGSAPYVLLLNQDARLAQDFVRLLVERLEADDRIGSASGKLLHLEPGSKTHDDVIDSCGLEMRRGRRAVDIGQGDIDGGQYDGLREVFGVSAAAAAYRRAALEQVSVDGSVFDSRFFMYKEDVDLAWRLRAAGWTAFVDSAALAYHGRSVARLPETGGGTLSRIRNLVRQERGKSRRVRQLAWRNQLLLLVKNERARDLVRSLPDLLIMQLGYLATGLIVDPVGTAAVRIRAIADLVPAMRARRAWRRSVAVDVSPWLP